MIVFQTLFVFAAILHKREIYHAWGEKMLITDLKVSSKRLCRSEKVIPNWEQSLWRLMFIFVLVKTQVSPRRSMANWIRVYLLHLIYNVEFLPRNIDRGFLSYHVPWGNKIARIIHMQLANGTTTKDIYTWWNLGKHNQVSWISSLQMNFFLHIFAILPIIL